MVAQSLGRPLSGNAANVTVNLIEPGSLYGDRLNELNLRVGKILKLGRTRANIGVDVFNLLNVAPILSYIVHPRRLVAHAGHCDEGSILQDRRTVQFLV